MTREEKIKGLYSLKEYLVENHIELEGHKSLPITLIDYAIQALEQEPKIGHWIPLCNYDPWRHEGCYKCSECGDINTYPDYYCPNCGTKMTERDDYFKDVKS